MEKEVKGTKDRTREIKSAYEGFVENLIFDINEIIDSGLYEGELLATKIEKAIASNSVNYCREIRDLKIEDNASASSETNQLVINHFKVMAVKEFVKRFYNSGRLYVCLRK